MTAIQNTDKNTPKDFYISWFSNLSIMSVPDDGYFMNESCKPILYPRIYIL